MLSITLLSALLAAVPAAPSGVVRGRVLDVSGAPVPGASAVARPETGEAAAEWLRDTGKERETAGRASTGADGRFSIALRSGTYELEISATGLATAVIDSAATGDDVGDVFLPNAVPASGVVLDSRGRGVAGAWVTVTADDRDDDSGARFATTVRTDEKGNYSAPAAAAPVFAIEAAAKGSPLGSTFRFGFARRRTGSTSVRLDSGRTLTGVVRKPDGSPAAGALVSSSGHAVKTGDDGSFAIEGVAAGPTVIAAESGDLRASASAARGASRVELSLTPSATLTGLVIDAVTRKPVARASIRIRGEGPRRHAGDRKGAFEVRGLAPGEASVSAEKHGYAASPFREVQLAASSSARAGIALVPLARVEGRVVDGGDKPVAGARVSAPPDERVVRTGKDGAFAVFADGTREVRLAASADGFAPAWVGGIRVKPGQTKKNVAVRLTPGAGLAGRVVDDAGKPVGGAKVAYETDPENGGRRGFGRARFGGPAASSESEFVVTNAAGRFAVAHLAPGTYRLNVSHPGHAEKAVSGIRAPGDGKPVPDVVLDPAAAIEGFVRDGTGQPVVAAQVAAHAASTDESAETGPDGSFRLTTFPAGAKPLLFAFASGYTNARRTVEAPAKGVVLTLGADAYLRGRVEDSASGAAITSFSIDTSASGGFRPGGRIRGMAGEAFESADGTFEHRVPPGKWTATVSAPGHAPASIGDLEVGPGETKDGLVFRLGSGSRVDGAVVEDQSGLPIPGAAVTWTAAGGSVVRQFPGGMIQGDGATAADDNGRFELTGLPGNEHITVTAQDWAHSPASADVTTGGEATLTIRLSSGSEIDGVLAGADGSGVPGGTVDLAPLGGDGAPQESATDGSGTFVFEHLTAGSYRLTGRSGARSTVPREVAVAAGQSASGVTLTLAGGATVVGKATGLSASDLAALRVRATGANGFTGSATPDASGAYEIDGAPPGEVRVTGMVTGTDGRSLTRSAEIADDATQVEVDLDFSPGGTLSGTVTRGGAPQAQISVSAQPEVANGSATTARGLTDENGRYAISGLDDGDYVVRASSFGVPGGGAPHEEPVTVSGDTTLDIDLPTLSITGSVVESGSNDPVAGASVSADGGAAGNGAVIPRSSTDSSGSFTLDGLGSGDFQLSVSKSGWQSKNQPVTVTDGNAEVTVELTRAEGITIHGNDGTTGIPLGSIQALFFGGGGGVAFDGSVSLDSTGRGEIPQLAPGSYAAYFFARGYAPQAAGTLQIPTPPLTLAFTFGGELDIRTDAANAGAPASLTAANGLAYLASAFQFDARFALAGTLTQRPRIAAGTYTLTIQWADGPKSYPVSIADGQTTTIAVP